LRKRCSDITDNVVRSCALELGLVDVKVAAVDENWSGLRLVWRAGNRASDPEKFQVGSQQPRDHGER
jgi:hypothetical protein